MKKKKWDEAIVKAWKHRIEQYRYAIRKGGYTRMFVERCDICTATAPQDKVGFHRCRKCPFALMPASYHNTHPCATKARLRAHIEMYAYLITKERLRAALRVRLAEIIHVGKETGVLR